MGEMKTTEEILYALECREKSVGCCETCAYEFEDCGDGLYADAAKLIRQLTDENRAMKAELKVNIGNQYWMNICKMNARQEAKGLEKYGEPLEENTTLTTVQRIEHLQEELIDALKYCEHLKAVSNDGITANDYQRAAMRTAGDDTENYLLNGVMGLCGESGEVIDIVKKHLFQGHELDKAKVAEETSDCLWYCALIATAIDMNLGDIMQLNIDKMKRRYPEGFRKERSINRGD